jgi:hypothetical protein
MAKLIEPSRWAEFPGRPGHTKTPTQHGPQRNSLRLGRWVVGDFRAQTDSDQPPICVIAGIVGQLAASADLPADMNGATDPRQFTVERSGIVVVPADYATTGYDLLTLFAELIGDQTVPPLIARLLLSKSDTEVGQLSTVLSAVGKQADVAEFIGRMSEVMTADGPDVYIDELPDEVPPYSSPIAERSADSSRFQTFAGSSVRRHGSSENARDSGGGKRRTVVAIVGAAVLASLGAMVVLGSGQEDSSEVALATTDQGDTKEVTPATPSQDVTPSQVSPASHASAPTQYATPPTPVTPPQPASWAALMTGLDVSRATAFATGRLELLSQVNVSGSPAARLDEETLRSLKQIGAVAKGYRSTINDVKVISMSSTHALLAVTDVLNAYQIVTRAKGAVVESRRQRASQSWQVTLRPADGQWRIYEAVMR